MPSPPSKHGSNKAQASTQNAGTVSDVESIKPDNGQNHEKPNGEPASHQRHEKVEEWVDAQDVPWNHVAALAGTSKDGTVNEASTSEEKHTK